MAPIAMKIMRAAFAAGEILAPNLAGKAAFALFCRTPSRAARTPGEREALRVAGDLMRDAQHHVIATPSGRVAIHEFSPQTGRTRGSVLLVHGWRSRTEHLRSLIAALRAADVRVFALDLPGHGASEGRTLHLASAVAAVAAAEARYGPFEAIVGHSFGGAVAINATAGSIRNIAPVSANRLVAIAAPSSLPRLFADFAALLGLGARTQAAFEHQVERVTGHVLGSFECREQLRRTRIPTLVIHDRDDREVSAEHARMTAQAGSHATLRWTSGLGHRRILNDAGVVSLVVAFIAETANAMCTEAPRQVAI
jgi:pimeloyl-ACP methyl ester carboxylesterase